MYFMISRNMLLVWNRHNRQVLHYRYRSRWRFQALDTWCFVLLYEPWPIRWKLRRIRLLRFRIWWLLLRLRQWDFTFEWFPGLQRCLRMWIRRSSGLYARVVWNKRSDRVNLQSNRASSFLWFRLLRRLQFRMLLSCSRRWAFHELVPARASRPVFNYSAY